MTDSTAPLDVQDLQKIAGLARLHIAPEQAEALTDSLCRILSLMDHLQTIDTEGVAPMASPHDRAQPLRPDAVSETNQREAYQAVAPAVQDGLYLVPRVIE